MVSVAANKPLRFLFLLLLSGVFLSCSDLFSPSTGYGTKKEIIEPQDGAAPLFREGYTPRFQLILSDSAWNWLQANATKEEYVPAELTIDGVEVGTVGLRYKGSYGNLFNCFKNGVQLPECPRLSFKIKFNKYNPDLRYNSLKRINLHSLRADQSLLRDRIGYRLFREMEIHAPRSSHAMVSVNGGAYALYGMIEAIDGRFTKSRWGSDGDGNLYKEVWPLSRTPEPYLRALKTNEEIGDVSGMVMFANDITGIYSVGDKALFSQYTDTDQAIRYLVTDLALDNIDGYRTFYCGSNPKSILDCGPHNFYWYQSEQKDFFTLIPWDLDATFPEGNWLPPVAAWDDTTFDCQSASTNGVNTIWSPRCDYYFGTLAKDYRAEYLAAVEKLLHGPFSSGVAEAYIDRWVQDLSPFVEEDTLYDVASWRGSVERLKMLIAMNRWKMEQRLQEKVPELPALIPDGLNTFDDLTSATVTGLASYYSAPHSQLQSLVETEAPLAGNASWRLEWVYRNEPGIPWGQWGSWSAVWKGNRVADLLRAKALRLTAVAETNRRFNIDLSSSKNSLPNAGKSWGWEFIISDTPQVIELSLDPDRLRYAWGGEDPVADGQPPLDTLLKYSTGLVFYPVQIGRQNNGLYPEGVVDSSWVVIDNLEILY